VAGDERVLRYRLSYGDVAERPAEDLMPDTRLIVTGALLVVAGVAWLFTARPGPERSALATVVSKGYVAAGTYVQQRAGASRGFTAPTDIAIAESNVFELRVDGVAGPVRASFNTVKGRRFEVGQRVRVRLMRRGLPPIWSRLVVVDMTPADSA
jgi:hypothetical protein